jgi:hypothetical protein
MMNRFFSSGQKQTKKEKASANQLVPNTCHKSNQQEEDDSSIAFVSQLGPTSSNSTVKTSNFLKVDSASANQMETKHRRPSIFDYMNEHDMESDELLKTGGLGSARQASFSSNEPINTTITTTLTSSTANRLVLNGSKSVDSNNRFMQYSVSSDNFGKHLTVNGEMVSDIMGSGSTVGGSSTSQIPLLQISYASDDQTDENDVFDANPGKC